ncbi:unnamed protein product, partial [Durusdinium trenchii]
QVPSADIFPNGFEGRLEMQKKWVSDTGMREEHKQYNSTCRPTINVKISLRDDYFTGAGPGPLTLSLPQTQQAVSMPDMQPTTGACRFELARALSERESCNRVSCMSCFCLSDVVTS